MVAKRKWFSLFLIVAMLAVLGLTAAVASAAPDVPGDLDNDGLSDAFEQRAGSCTKYNVADTDGDGLWDGPAGPGAGEDKNANGIMEANETDPCNPDTDGDGVTDGQEVLDHATDPRKPDTDGDGLNDYDEIFVYKTNPLVADTDADGLKDGEEVNTYKTNPLVADTDKDGIPDGIEAKTGINKTDPLKPDTDGDGLCDGDGSGGAVAAGKCVKGEDVNNDGMIAGDANNNLVMNAGEVWTETNPNKADTDGDTLSDIDEGNPAQAGGARPGLKYCTDALKKDTDGDSLTDDWEVTNGTDACNAAGDKDKDGIPDGIEVNGTNKTNPLNPDTDGDGLCDGDGSGGAVAAGKCVKGEDVDKNGKIAGDANNNLVLDAGEVWTESNPNKADTDGDSLSDFDEDTAAHNGKLCTSATLADTDGDGLTDGFELTNGLGACPGDDQDKDNDGIPDGVEYATGTYYDKPDTDGDGLCDGPVAVPDPANPAKNLCEAGEDMSFDGKLDAGETDPRKADTDGDGLSDGFEVLNPDYACLDPLDTDSDDDGLTDGWEIANGTDPCVDGDIDGDGIKDGKEFATGTLFNDPDTDNDGLCDGLAAAPIVDPVTGAEICRDGEDADGNGKVTTVAGPPITKVETDPRKVDSDGDTLSDFDEFSPVHAGKYCTDALKVDTDVDGLSDGWEVTNGTDACNAAGDKDKDGWTDAQEVFPELPANAGIKLWCANFDVADMDKDGVPDGTGNEDVDGNMKVAGDDNNNHVWDAGEVWTETDPCNADSDGDTLKDGAEAHPAAVAPIYCTNPLMVDTDLDGLTDGWEITNGTAACNGYGDKDKDGIPDATEFTTGTLFNKADTDGDGLCDGNGAVPPPAVVGWVGAPAPLGPPAANVCVGFEDANNNGAKSAAETDPRKADTDGDGLSDGVEKGVKPLPVGVVCSVPATLNPLSTDSDADGLTDSWEATNGTDVCADADKDKDGWLDKWEVFSEKYSGVTGGLWCANFNTADMDSDGLLDGQEDADRATPDPLDPTKFPGLMKVAGDTNNNHVWSLDEVWTETDPCNADTDGDGLSDGTQETAAGTNKLNPDTDGDKLWDGWEVANGTKPLLEFGDKDHDGWSDALEYFAKAKGLLWCADFNTADMDADGLPDGMEATYPRNWAAPYAIPATNDITGDAVKIAGDTNNDRVWDKGEVWTETDPCNPDTDGDTLKDGTGEDKNFNGITEVTETDPLKVDTDGDGMPDAYEVKYACLLPGQADAAWDLDGDGLLNYVAGAAINSEMEAGTNPCKADTDGDGAPDGAEVLGMPGPYDSPLKTQTCNPLKPDTDGDGLTDGQEGMAVLPLAADDGYITDCNKADTDDGGLTDGQEWELSKMGPMFRHNPLNGLDDKSDADGDGLSDGQEVLLAAGGACPSIANPDSDGDGLKDGAEVNTYKTNPCKPDTDGDLISDGDEVNYTKTDPTKADTDGDGLNDGDELFVTHTDPTKPDTDGDGLTDGQEVNTTHTDPTKADTDGDGIGDAAEINTWHTDPLKADTDGDGMPDGYEVQHDCLKPLVKDADADPDGDGYTNAQEMAMGTNPCVFNCDIKYDWNQDGEVTVADVLMMVPHWQETQASPNWVAAYDVDGDKVITVIDFMMVVNHIGDACQKP